MELNKLKGLIIGGALGDALGAPHELRYQKDKYTGNLDYRARFFNRFTGEIFFEKGQITDDTEMHLCIINRLIQDKKYILDNVILEYMEWANSGTNSMGRNTRELLKGVKTLNGYKKRYEKKFSDDDIRENTLGNGCLMRCGILGFLLYKDKKNLVNIKNDCYITNPNNISYECNLVLTKLISLCFKNKDKKYIKKYLLKNIDKYNDKVKEYVMYGIENKDIEINNKSKGLCLYGLYCAILGLLHFTNYKTAIDFIINKKGDTDTNACISGYLLGSYYGYDNLEDCEKNNIKTLLNCSTKKSDKVRDEKYRLTKVMSKIEELYKIIS